MEYGYKKKTKWKILTIRKAESIIFLWNNQNIRRTLWKEHSVHGVKQ